MKQSALTQARIGQVLDHKANPGVFEFAKLSLTALVVVGAEIPHLLQYRGELVVQDVGRAKYCLDGTPVAPDLGRVSHTPNVYPRPERFQVCPASRTLTHFLP